MRVPGFALLATMVAGCYAPEADRPARVTELRPDRREAPRGADLLRRAMLDVHDVARAAADVPLLAWSDALAADAARYAAVLAATGRFRHSVEPRGDRPEGENLFTGTRGAYRYDEMARLWVDEKRYYRAAPVPDFSITGRWQDVAHYTQIVWRGTTEVGCALASSATDDYLVCRYAPPGNVWGRRAEG